MTVAISHRVIIDECPLPELSPNDRSHRGARIRATKAARRASWSAGYSHWVGFSETPEGQHLREPEATIFGRDPVELRVLIVWKPRGKLHDDDNARAMLKAYIDGLTDAGWWPDDRNVKVVECEQQLYGDSKLGPTGKYPRGLIRIDAIRADSDD